MLSTIDRFYKVFLPKSTAWRSAGLSSAVMFQLLSAPLQCSIRLFQLLCPTFPDALRLRFYPCYLHEIGGRERRASTFRINDKIMRLGSSCLPTGQRSRISCVKRLYLASLPFGEERFILFFAPCVITAVAECSIILAIPINPCP